MPTNAFGNRNKMTLVMFIVILFWKDQLLIEPVYPQLSSVVLIEEIIVFMRMHQYYKPVVIDNVMVGGISWLRVQFYLFRIYTHQITQQYLLVTYSSSLYSDLALLYATIGTAVRCVSFFFNGSHANFVVSSFEGHDSKVFLHSKLSLFPVEGHRTN